MTVIVLNHLNKAMIGNNCISTANPTAYNTNNDGPTPLTTFLREMVLSVSDEEHEDDDSSTSSSSSSWSSLSDDSDQDGGLCYPHHSHTHRISILSDNAKTPASMMNKLFQQHVSLVQAAVKEEQTTTCCRPAGASKSRWDSCSSTAKDCLPKIAGGMRRPTRTPSFSKDIPISNLVQSLHTIRLSTTGTNSCGDDCNHTADDTDMPCQSCSLERTVDYLDAALAIANHTHIVVTTATNTNTR
jgi:hypothetical protein